MSAALSPAGFWKRYVAYFIDFLLISVVVNVLATVLLGLFGAGLAASQDELLRMAQDMAQGGAVTDPVELLAQFGPWLAWATAVSTLLYVVVAGVYFVLTEASPKQGSFGKQLLGLHVTDRDGQPITRARALGRFFAAGLSWLTLNVGHALAAWTRQRRALHDFVAGTRVVNADPSKPGMPAWGWAIVALNAMVFLAFALVGVIAGVILGQLYLAG